MGEDLLGLRSISSVSASTNQEPPSGSATCATPVSCAITCWVRSAIRAAFSVGSASTSSIEFVCRLWVPAEHAGERLDRRPHDVHLGLLGGQRDAGGLSVEPQLQRPRVRRAVVLRSQRAQIRRAARYLAISSKKSMWALKKKLSRGANSSTSSPACHRRLDVGEAVGERERQLLRGRRPGLADVVAGDRDRVEPRHLGRAERIMSVTIRIDGRGGKTYSFCAWYSFKMSFWSVPPRRVRAAYRPSRRPPRTSPAGSPPAS